jgi:hypothetical protein
VLLRAVLSGDLLGGASLGKCEDGELSGILECNGGLAMVVFSNTASSTVLMCSFPHLLSFYDSSSHTYFPFISQLRAPYLNAWCNTINITHYADWSHTD